MSGCTGDTARPLREMLKEARNGRDKLTLEALVVTHFDADHINGINGLLKNKPDWLDIKDVWFNGPWAKPNPKKRTKTKEKNLRI